MSDLEHSRRSFRDRWKWAFGWLGPDRPGGASPSLREDRLSLMYERFREILALNDNLLQLFADIEDKLLGNRPFALGPITQAVRRATGNVYVMARDLNLIADNRYRELYDVLRQLTADIELQCEEQPRIRGGPLVMPLDKLRAEDAPLAGGKMANLGEVRGKLRLSVPDGFVITAAAFDR